MATTDRETDELAREPADTRVVVEARQRWQRAADASDAQRRSILEAKQFRAGDQWPPEIKIQRAGGSGISGQAPQPPRPCLTIDRLSQPVRTVSNAIRSANFSITVVPNGHGADEATAAIFKGIIRSIQSQARAAGPIEWAADSAAEAGLGWFRLRTRYVPADPAQPGPELFDQEILVERILNPLTVYVDPTATLPTRSDAQWLFVTEDVSRDEFQRRFPGAEVASLDEFEAIGDLKSWVTEDTIRIAEYWRIDYESVCVWQLADGSVGQGDPPDDVQQQREVQVPRVRCSIIDAVEELAAYDWLGSHIPLIPILGEELNVDGAVILRGVIQEGMDAQRMVNYMYSAAIETVALAPKAPLLVAEGQLEGYEQLWQQANRYNYSYLPYKPTSLSGQPVPPPQRQTAEPPIDAMVLMLAKSEDAIKATTGLWDPSLGNTSPRERSGRAIRFLQQQGELGSSNYLDNVSRALVYAGEQLVELIPKIYTRPGRLVEILGADDLPQGILLGQPFTTQQGQPVPVSPEQQAMRQGLVQFYDLSKGRYSVTVDVGKAYATKRDEAASLLGDMLSQNPQLLQVFGDIFFSDLDFEGAQEIASRMRKMLPPQLQPQSDQPSPEQQQAQITQLQQAAQAMSQQLQQQQQVIQAKEIESQRDLQKAQIDQQTKLEIAKIQAGATIEAADIKAQIQQQGLVLEQIRTVLEAAQEERLQTQAQLHETAMQARDHAHETVHGAPAGVIP